MEKQSENTSTAEERAWVLDQLPQQRPFRFVDEIVELSTKHIVSQYRFKPDEFFYQGHFPGDPVTPGVILIESMAQGGLVSLGIYIVSKEPPGPNLRTLFTEGQQEFFKLVRPGNLVTVRGELVFWRKKKIQCKVEMRLEDGTLAASGLLSGMGVKVP